MPLLKNWMTYSCKIVSGVHLDVAVGDGEENPNPRITYVNLFSTAEDVIVTICGSLRTKGSSMCLDMYLMSLSFLAKCCDGREICVSLVERFMKQVMMLYFRMA